MKTILRALVGLALPLSLASAAAAFAASSDTYAIVVNVENAISGPRARTIETVRRLYLKEQRDWPDGSVAIGFARPAESDEEKAFRDLILHMDDSRLESHWLRMKQTQGVAPPRAVGSTTILLRQLRARPNAFGVVRSSELGDMTGLRVLLEFGGVVHD